MIFAIAIMFHGKHGNKGYDSTDFFCETCPPMASDKVKKGYNSTPTLKISFCTDIIYDRVPYIPLIVLVC